MQRARWVVMAAGLVAATAAPPDARAVAPRGLAGATRAAAPLAAETLTALPAAGITKPLRAERELRADPAVASSAAWQAFTRAAGGQWRVTWDAATGVPNRIYGSGLAAPGASASAAVAAQHARSVLAAQLSLLAPGASPADFVLVANHSDGDQRSVGFVQRVGGRRVVGGQVSFRYKRDRLFVIASEALPHVTVAPAPARAARVDPVATLRQVLALPHAPASPLGDEVVLPLVARDAVLGYRAARPLTLDGGAAGRYLAYVDPASGAPLAVVQLNAYATGRVRYRSVERYPGRGRVDLPAQRAQLLVNGAPQTTDAAGQVTLADTGTQAITVGVAGDLVIVKNLLAPMAAASATLAVTPGGEAVWDASAVTAMDAQVVTFTAVNTAKEYIRASMDPTIPWLDEQIVANVNVDGECNAFYANNTVNFFRENDVCENTGLIADVIYHELGHALHDHEIIEGVGFFDPGMSEGISDFLAASITGDPAMGRGFLRRDEPLRDIDPADTENRWPRDIGEVHHTGKIIGGTFWDLRKAAIARLGEAAGIRLVNKLYIASLRRATGIPSSLVESLAADDDDGDLANGTPNECIIRAAFAQHGMRSVTGRIAPPVPGGTPGETSVQLELADLSPRCPEVDAITRVELAWRPSGRPGQPAQGSVPMTAIDPTHYTAVMPLPVDSVLEYQARLYFPDGASITLPDNYVEPYYELYAGDTVPLYCTDFATDPFAEGWTRSATTNSSAFEWGTPAASLYDPPAAYSGMHALGQAFGAPYSPDTAAWVQLPTIDTGAWSDVRLHYRRWLAVEDSFYDQAQISVNGTAVWTNGTQDVGTLSSFAHLDREWMFQDVPLSEASRGRPIDLRFALTTDEGLEYGGWAIDDVCIVANVHSICGDGVVSASEGCDLGAANANAADACRSYCQIPTCGDFITDTNEQCDAGPDGTETCSAACTNLGAIEQGGCAATSGTALPFGMLAGMLALLTGTGRRRRRALAP